MNEDRIYQLLGDLANNSISATGYAELMQYLRDAEDDPALQSAIDRIWAELAPEQELHPDESEALYQQIIANDRFVLPQYRRRRWGWLGYAAAVSLLLVTGAIAYWLAAPPADIPIVYKELIAPAGQRIQLKLADGSQVWIKGGSKLRYPENFADSARVLFLEGEAYFDVTPRDKQPFLVHTGNVTTRVLGTAFNIQTRNQQLTVAVVNGKVSVAEGETALGVIVADQFLEYHTDNKQVILKDTTAGNIVAWTKGELIFDNATMEDAAATISNWYNVNIVFDSPELKKYRFSLSFLHGEDIREVMNAISYLNDFSYRMEGNVITVSAKRK